MVYYTWKSYKLKLEPFEIFRSLSEKRNCFFLDSCLNSRLLGRYSFLGCEPFEVVSLKQEAPFTKLRQLLDRCRIPQRKLPFPFFGGAVGYLSYDLGFVLEKKVDKGNKPESGLPDCFFGFYNTAIIIDNFCRRLYIAAVGLPEKNEHFAKAFCKDNIRRVEKLLLNCSQQKKTISPLKKYCRCELTPDFTKREYISAVKRAKEYIKDGDIYQVNLSQRFKAKSDVSGVEIYRRLRRISPTDFSAYFRAGDLEVISSSPERFLQLGQDKVVITRPMKGTRPRSGNKLLDKKLKETLLASAKDKAELTMIVDLERNDFGRVCDYGSIKVAKLRELEEYNTVYQTTATVEARLHKGKDRLDLLRACFPGGSITGCPKIRSMQIIEELEPSRRFIYTGSLGYLSFSGQMDFNILIRTILKKGSGISFGVGSGIVADSSPEEEYNEMLVKAKAMIQALNPL